MRYSWVVLMLFLVSCGSGPAGAPPEFSHVVEGPNQPWTHENFDNADDKFTFALFSDLTGGERERVFEVAIAQLNLLRPEFILNVGDLIEGDSPDRAELVRQWESFDARATKAKSPVFYVGGNHDLSNDLLGQVWDERNGPRYYHFLYRDVLFLVLDTEDTRSERRAEIAALRERAVEVYKREGLEAFEKTEYSSLSERTAGVVSAEQSAHFRKVLAEYTDVRWTFLVIHKPAWESPGEENFAAIEAALAGRPYTVFNGHGQFYRYEQRLGRDYVQLATTGGEQFPEYGPSMDHLTFVTVSAEGVDIVNLRMDGILDKTGNVPLGGGDLCFEKVVYGDER